MPRRVFVDASAWLAVIDESDTHHSEAVEIYRRLLKDRTMLEVTILVIAEVQIWLRRHLGIEPARIFLNNINESARIEIIYPSETLEKKAKQILYQFADQDFSLTDALSFAWMRETGLSEVFAYDHHFITAGFQILTL